MVMLKKMGLLDDIQRKISKSSRKMQKDTSKSFRKSQKAKTKSLRKSQKDIQKEFLKIMNLAVRKEINQEKRVPIPPKTRKEIKERFNNTCDIKTCHKKNPLDIHHVNMKSWDNKPSNLRLLCANHHRLEHQKKFRRGNKLILKKKKK